MGDIAEAIERGNDPCLALDDHAITDPAERQILESTMAAMQRLHSEGRNHIWAYYTRNLVRPVALSLSKVDVIVGNPPWLNYNKTVSTFARSLRGKARTSTASGQAAATLPTRTWQGCSSPAVPTSTSRMAASSAW